MIAFKISDIPMGKSGQQMAFDPEDIALGDLDFSGGELLLDFERLATSIKVDFQVEGVARLICDRSLDPFDFPISRSYTVIFREDHREDEEDEFVADRKLDLNRNRLDITEEVRQTILLEVPIKKLHPRFLDEEGNPTDFEMDTNSDEEETDAEPDNRWDALKKLQNPDN